MLQFQRQASCPQFPEENLPHLKQALTPGSAKQTLQTPWGQHIASCYLSALGTDSSHLKVAQE